MRHLVTGLLIIFFSSAITGCAPPTGSITGSGNNRGIYDFLMLRPNRILYELDGGVDGRFNRADDLRVFVADDNGYRMLDVFDPGLKLEIILNAGVAGETSPPPIVINGIFPFSDPGRHIVRGTYGNKTDEYSIEVRGTLVKPGDGSGFVGIDWQ